jgi:hypothetical protein
MEMTDQLQEGTIFLKGNSDPLLFALKTASEMASHLLSDFELIKLVNLTCKVKSNCFSRVSKSGEYLKRNKNWKARVAYDFRESINMAKTTLFRQFRQVVEALRSSAQSVQLRQLPIRLREPTFLI